MTYQEFLDMKESDNLFFNNVSKLFIKNSYSFNLAIDPYLFLSMFFNQN